MNQELAASKMHLTKILHQHVERYLVGLDESVIGEMLDRAKNGEMANVYLDPVPVGGSAMVRDVAAATADKPLSVVKPAQDKKIACDIYLTGSLGKWRKTACKELGEYKVYDSATVAKSPPEMRFVVPSGVETGFVLAHIPDGCDAPAIVGGLITTVWYHGMSVVAHIGRCPFREVLLALCRLAGATVCDSLKEAIETVGQMADRGPRNQMPIDTDDSDDDDEEQKEYITAKEDNDIVVHLPSGNELVIHYFGNDAYTERILILGKSCGAGNAPLNLDIIIPDPDIQEDEELPEGVVEDGDTPIPAKVHRIRVRYSGPADSGYFKLPPDFLPAEEDE